nr:ATP-grasp domain-containing protein [Hyphobacterium sp. CCMP332]
MAQTSRRELYLALLVDRVTSRVSLRRSTEGGMDIEAVAEKTRRRSSPPVDPASRLQPFHTAASPSASGWRRSP